MSIRPRRLADERQPSVGYNDLETAFGVADLADQLRRRRAAALRSVPLTGGFRDPLDRLASPPGPSDFGLCRTDLLTEIGRCRKAGWADWELRVRFTNPQQVAA
jgi:hypothetical protein